MPVGTPIRAGLIAACTAVACTCYSSAQAAEPGYEIQLGAIQSDNIERLPSGGSDGTILTQELAFTWQDKRPWLDSDIDANLGHLSYYPHTFGDQIVGNFLGQVQVSLAPQLLSWNIADNFGQLPLDALAPITPANQEYFNVFNTGPTLSLPLGQTTQLNVIGEYGRVTYQHSPLNSTLLTGGLGLIHELSSKSNISLNVRDERTEFANSQLNPDYDMQEAFMHFSATGSRTDLRVDVGYNRALLPGNDSGGVLARLDLTRKISTSSNIGLVLGHHISDAGDTFRLVQTQGGATLNTQPVLATAAPFQEDFGTLGWNFERARTTVGLIASYYRDRYPTAAVENNNDVTTFDATVTRRITPTLELALSEYLVRWQFDAGRGSTTTTDSSLQLTWRAGRRLSISLAYLHSHGISDIQTNEYAENRVSLLIGYGRPAKAPPGPAPVRMPINH